ncbi:MAG TPA: hypothetical protein VE093_24760 [Polyangiaceae bacterium]|jgi:hypothetical protein|nr:hypothetical protein [Polyangiaceae bacterium]
MKTGSEKGKLTAQDLDLRVRDRHLTAGVFDQKTIERHLAELQDVEAQSEAIAVDQPAIGGVEPGRPGPTTGST